MALNEDVNVDGADGSCSHTSSTRFCASVLLVCERVPLISLPRAENCVRQGQQQRTHCMCALGTECVCVCECDLDRAPNTSGRLWQYCSALR